MKNEVMKLERNITKTELGHFLSQYDGAISYIDFHIGKMIERLKKIGLYENSLIIITSDHGETFGDRHFIGHAKSVYQDQLYVPLIIKYPQNKESYVFDGFVSLTDLLPTIIDVLGLESPDKKTPGQSLQRYKLKEAISKPVFGESFPNSLMFKFHTRFQRGIERAIFSGSFKFIGSTSGKKECYNLQKDPDEKDNIYKTNNDKCDELEVGLKQFVKRYFSKKKTESKASVKLDKGTQERLKSLGYIR